MLGLVLGGAALALAATTLLYLRRRSKQASVKEEPVQVGYDWSAAATSPPIGPGVLLLHLPAAERGRGPAAARGAPHGGPGAGAGGRGDILHQEGCHAAHLRIRQLHR